ncbi:MAG: AraC family transcriptional regulator [Alistipes sp.]|nr:AraC family transcriptional regulator [Alistipes sp.]
MDNATKYHYLIPNKSDEQYGCTINSVGSQNVAPNENYPNIEHSQGYVFDPNHGRILHEYQLLYIVKGRGVFSDKNGTHQVSKGSLILIRPGCWHTYKPQEDVGWNEYFIGFSGSEVEHAVEMLFGADEQIFNVGQNKELIEFFQRAIKIAYDDRIGAQPLLTGIVMHMLGIINYTVRNETLTTDRLVQIVEKSKAIMQEHVLQDIDFEELAAQLNVSYSWFRKIFREYTGYPPAKYFTHVKLRHAQYLLTDTSESIKEIAFMLNFKSAEHFYTTFKRTIGCTPNAYRQMTNRE